MTSAASDTTLPLVVRTHVTPWGFFVALTFAVGFAYLGARALDIMLLPAEIGRFHDVPFWLFSALLLAFALFLFLVGVGELASYLKPGIEVMIDDDGIATFGLLGERRLPWSDITTAYVRDGHLELVGRQRRGQRLRHVRLQFARLAVEPVDLITAIAARRADLVAAQLRI